MGAIIFLLVIFFIFLFIGVIRGFSAASMAEKNEKELKQQVQLIMKDAEKVTYMDEILVTWKASKESKFFDSKAFKAEHPELYEQYLQTKPGSRRFLVK